MAELVQLGTPAICVPGERGFDDQFERVREIAAARLSVRAYEGVDPTELSNLMSEMLGEDNSGRIRQLSYGAVYAARILLKNLASV